MQFIRKFLVSFLGVKTYLRIVSKTYIKLTDMGFLKDKYPELFFLDQLIQPNWTCIDIGSNLGYYSNRIHKKLKTGMLYAVEPIPLFVEVWEKNINHTALNVELFNVALGEENKEVIMSIPMKNGVVRHGLTQIDESSDSEIEKVISYSVQMKRSEDVFGFLQEIDFIKIDVEGYEQFVLTSMKTILEDKKPIIQAEIGGKENRKNTYDLLIGMGYEMYYLVNHKLTVLSESKFSNLSQDIYFVHKDRKEEISFLI